MAAWRKQSLKNAENAGKRKNCGREKKATFKVKVKETALVSDLHLEMKQLVLNGMETVFCSLKSNRVTLFPPPKKDDNNIINKDCS